MKPALPLSLPLSSSSLLPPPKKPKNDRILSFRYNFLHSLQKISKSFENGSHTHFSTFPKQRQIGDIFTRSWSYET